MPSLPGRVSSSRFSVGPGGGHGTLSEQIEKAARTHQLGSDDDTFADEHAARASGLLVQVAGEVAEAGLAGNQAWNALGHLKLTEQPGSAAALAP